MKKILSALTCILMAAIVTAQMPNTVNYQAVARNNSGQALASQNIKVRLSILRGPTSLYSETRNVTTNTLGLFNVQIGSTGATATTGDFSTIYWLNNTPAITLKVELDVNNSGVFTEMGNQTLASVPYAYAAKNSIDAVNLGGRYVDASIIPADGDVMKWSSGDNAWKPAKAGSFTSMNLAGFIGNTVASNTQFVFIGPTATATTTITVEAGTTINAHFTAILGLSAGGPATDVSIMPAWQQGSGTVTIFNPGNYPAFTVTTTKSSYSISGTYTFTTAGTYKIGCAIRNNTAVTLNNNDWVQGYIQIVK